MDVKNAAGFETVYDSCLSAKDGKICHLLACIGYLETNSDDNHTGPINSGLKILGSTLNQLPNLERWNSLESVKSGCDENIFWSHNESTLVLALHFDNAHDEKNHASLAVQTAEAYEKILSFIKGSQFPHIYRIWNYIRDINAGFDDQERYKQFCLGRAQAFDKFEYSDEQYPAACAIGNKGKCSVIYLCASKVVPTHFENPDQISAYKYPRQYGPRSPSFARATCLDSKRIWISGTAAVVGHKTVYSKSLEDQIRVTFDNLTRLTTFIANKNNVSGYEPLQLKVYLRHAEDYEKARTEVLKYCQKDTPIIFVQGDICRDNLLIEVDGEYGLSSPK